MSEDNDDNKHVALWRQDPNNSFSDWAIEVQSKEEKVTFHVHKNILSAGPRSSEYFQAVFNSTSMKESQTQTTTMKVDALVLEAFPDFLDYIYSFLAAPVDIMSETAVALRHLAKYFGVSSLLEEVDEFISYDLGPFKNIDIYCEDALKLHDDEVFDKCMKAAAKDRRSVMEALGIRSIMNKRETSTHRMIKLLSEDQQIVCLLKNALAVADMDYTFMGQKAVAESKRWGSLSELTCELRKANMSHLVLDRDSIRFLK